jgi:Cu2+-exporting ATPase
MLLELGAAGLIGWAISSRRAKHRQGKAAEPAQAGVKPAALIRTRTQQLKELAGQARTRISARQRNNNLNLAVATATLAITGVGALLSSPMVLLGLPGVFYNSTPHFKDAYKILLKERRLGIGALDSVIVVACVGTGYYFAAAISNFFYYFSRNLLLRTEDLSKRTLTNVFTELPARVWLADRYSNEEIEVALDSVHAGDTVVVGAGGVIPTDGKIIEGYASIDQHMLTGESQSAEKEAGDPVFASTVVLSGKIYIRVEQAGKDTVVSKITEILLRTFNFKTSLQSRGEAIADFSAGPMLALGAIALPIVGVNGAVAVVNSNFGVNMRVIAPFATLSFLTLASSKGVLIKDGRIFELLNSVDTVVFDKTGTLTIDQPHVRKVHALDSHSEDELLALAASMEHRQTHPIARAIQQEAKARNLELPDFSDNHYEMGRGLQAKIDDRIVLLGSDRFMTMKGIVLTENIKAIRKRSEERGYSVVMVAIDGKIAGAIELHATIRSEVKEVVKSLKRFGMKIYIISGDQEQPTKTLADELEVDHYFANTLPENKAELVDQLQNQGRSVCFIGDGINDSIALKQADVSVSLRGASTIAIDTAQIILMDEKLTHLPSIFELAKDYEQNVGRSFLMTLLPGAVNISSALSSGVILSVILDRLGQFSGVVNGTLPLVKRRYWPDGLKLRGLFRRTAEPSADA